MGWELGLVRRCVEIKCVELYEVGPEMYKGGDAKHIGEGGGWRH